MNPTVTGVPIGRRSPRKRGPYSTPFNSEKHIAGGRARPRKALFAAAMVASLRWNPALVALRKRLLEKDKAYRLVIVACARKLLAQINAVLTRGTPWKEAPS